MSGPVRNVRYDRLADGTPARVRLQKLEADLKDRLAAGEFRTIEQWRAMRQSVVDPLLDQLHVTKTSFMNVRSQSDLDQMIAMAKEEAEVVLQPHIPPAPVAAAVQRNIQAEEARQAAAAAVAAAGAGSQRAQSARAQPAPRNLPPPATQLTVVPGPAPVAVAAAPPPVAPAPAAPAPASVRAAAGGAPPTSQAPGFIRRTLANVGLVQLSKEEKLADLQAQPGWAQWAAANPELAAKVVAGRGASVPYTVQQAESVPPLVGRVAVPGPPALPPGQVALPAYALPPPVRVGRIIPDESSVHPDFDLSKPPEIFPARFSVAPPPARVPLAQYYAAQQAPPAPLLAVPRAAAAPVSYAFAPRKSAGAARRVSCRIKKRSGKRRRSSRKSCGGQSRAALVQQARALGVHCIDKRSKAGLCAAIRRKSRA